MKELQRIIKLTEDGFDGNPWIDINLFTTLKTLSAQQAATKITPDINSIWEIVNHLISWRSNVLQRLQGKQLKTPPNNYFSTVKNPSAEAWERKLMELESSQKDVIQFLKKFKETEFDFIYTPNQLSYYEHIQGLIQHDVYHLGQIVLLIKLQKVSN